MNEENQQIKVVEKSPKKLQCVDILHVELEDTQMGNLLQQNTVYKNDEIKNSYLKMELETKVVIKNV